jgi:hypothetical protein
MKGSKGGLKIEQHRLLTYFCGCLVRLECLGSPQDGGSHLNEPEFLRRAAPGQDGCAERSAKIKPDRKTGKVS